MSILVDVTQEDIENGVAEDCLSCPIAIALERATNKKWAVGSEEVCPNDFIGPVYRLPQSARRFINRFDSGGVVKPFRFRFPGDSR